MVSPTVAAAPAPTVAKPGARPSTVRAEAPPAFIITNRRERQHYLKLLIYGDYGVGKTFLAGTAVDHEPMRDVLMLSAEGGDLTLTTADKKKHSFHLIDNVAAPNFRGIARFYDFLRLHCDARDKDDVEKLKDLQAKAFGKTVENDEDVKRYHTVIIDSLSEVDAQSMQDVLGIKDVSKLDEDMPQQTWDEYRENLRRMIRLIRQFRDLPMHVIFTAARAYAQDETKKFHYIPQLTGQLAEKVSGFMDVVGYYISGKPNEKGDIPRRLYVQPIGAFKAKCRFASYKGAHFDDPTIPTILKGVGLSE